MLLVFFSSLLPLGVLAQSRSFQNEMRMEMLHCCILFIPIVSVQWPMVGHLAWWHIPGEKSIDLFSEVSWPNPDSTTSWFQIRFSPDDNSEFSFNIKFTIFLVLFMLRRRKHVHLHFRYWTSRLENWTHILWVIRNGRIFKSPHQTLKIYFSFLKYV